MEGHPRREIVASWLVDVLVRKGDHEWWLSGAQRFATEQAAHEWGTVQMAHPLIERYRLAPSRLPPSPPDVFRK